MKKILITLIAILMFSVSCADVYAAGASQKTKSPEIPQSFFNTSVKVYPSVVTVQTQNAKGTGVIVESTGTVVTSFHKVANADYIKIKTQKGTTYNVNGVKYIDTDLNYAILTLDTKDKFQPVVLRDTKKLPKISEPVFGLTAEDKYFSLAEGKITGSSKKNISFTKNSDFVASGSPLFDADGKLFGVINSFSKTRIFAVPVSLFADKISLQTVINKKKQAWPEFLANNLPVEKLKEIEKYARDKKHYSMVYKYYKLLSKKYSYQDKLYPVIAFSALKTSFSKDDEKIWKDAQKLYETAQAKNVNRRATLYALYFIYATEKSPKADKIKTEIAKQYPLDMKHYVETAKHFKACKSDKKDCLKKHMVDENLSYLEKLTYQ